MDDHREVEVLQAAVASALLAHSLRVTEEPVRDLLRTGWRPRFAVGPGRDEVV